MRTLLRLSGALGLALLWSDAGADPPLSPVAEVGRQLFFDQSLSASGRMSCASCHDPAHAYAPANAQAVQLGGPQLDRPGTRAVPSLMYKEYTKAYSDRYANPDHVTPPAPGGGFTWDGRANSLAEQAATPLLAPNEMANPSAKAIVRKLRAAPYAEQFREAFGPKVFASDQRAFGKALAALEAFQREDRSFHPYSSRFDRYRNNKLGGTLTPAEQRGLLLYLDPNKGNCSACHLLGNGNDGSHDMTSDYSYAAIGVPRNPEIPANRDPKYFDLGLCGPLRRDHRKTATACGQFKTPSLRNVATRSVFMHNGYLKSLKDVLEFYNTRDTEPTRWYARDKFDDLPAVYRGNLDRSAPLDLRAPGSRPALTAVEIEDLLAFLKTLTDEAFLPVSAPPPTGVGKTPDSL